VLTATQQFVIIAIRLIQSYQAVKLSCFTSDISSNILASKMVEKNQTSQKFIFVKSYSTEMDLVRVRFCINSKLIIMSANIND